MQIFKMNIIEQVKKIIISRSNNFQEETKGTKDEYNLWLEHVQYVYKYAIMIAENKSVDKEVIELSALLHDIAMTDRNLERSKHNEYGCEIAGNILSELGYDWIVDIDLERFFDTVNHDRLTNIISRTIKDGNLISLIRAFLDSGVMVNGKYEDTPIGTPQGGNLSPLLSNIMLNELDRELEKRGLNFVRYADDCLILVGSKKAAERVMKSVVKFIEKKLGLIVNAEKSRIAKPTNIKYLGFGFYYDKDGKYYPRPHEKSTEKFKRKLKQLTCRSWSVSLTYRIERINEVVRGWVNYYKICNMKTHMKNISSHLRRRIRCIIWKQRKNTECRRKNLIKLKISPIIANRYACAGNKYWKMSMTTVIHNAISNKRLKQRGLLCPIDHYNRVHILPIG